MKLEELELIDLDDDDDEEDEDEDEEDEDDDDTIKADCGAEHVCNDMVVTGKCLLKGGHGGQHLCGWCTELFW